MGEQTACRLAKNKKKKKKGIVDDCGMLQNQDLNGEGEREAVAQCFFP